MWQRNVCFARERETHTFQFGFIQEIFRSVSYISAPQNQFFFHICPTHTDDGDDTIVDVNVSLQPNFSVVCYFQQRYLPHRTHNYIVQNIHNTHRDIVLFFSSFRSCLFSIVCSPFAPVDDDGRITGKKAFPVCVCVCVWAVENLPDSK